MSVRTVGRRRSAAALALLTCAAATTAAASGTAVAATAAPASSTASCHVTWGSLPKRVPFAGPGESDWPQTLAIRAGHHACFDRVVVDVRHLAGPVRAAYEPSVVAREAIVLRWPLVRERKNESRTTKMSQRESGGQISPKMSHENESSQAAP